MADSSWMKTLAGGAVGAIISAAVALAVLWVQETRHEEELARKAEEVRLEKEIRFKVITRNMENEIGAFYELYFEGNQWDRQIDSALKKVRNWRTIPELTNNLQSINSDLDVNLKDAERLGVYLRSASDEIEGFGDERDHQIARIQYLLKTFSTHLLSQMRDNKKEVTDAIQMLGYLADDAESRMLARGKVEEEWVPGALFLKDEVIVSGGKLAGCVLESLASFRGQPGKRYSDCEAQTDDWDRVSARMQ